MKSTILEHGYINVYSVLTLQERRQLDFVRRYKILHPKWDATTIRMCQLFEGVLKKEVVLDAGCGNGNYVVDEYRTDIKEAVGIDVAPEFTTKNICLDKIVHAPLESMPFVDQLFDVVLSQWVLEHVVNPRKVFEEIARVLKPGGFFIFCTPNKNSLLVRMIRMLRIRILKTLINRVLYGRKEEDVFETYYRANDIQTLKSLALQAGLEPILELNYDPGYTSFDSVTFWLSNWFNDKQHIIGICQKEGHENKKL